MAKELLQGTAPLINDSKNGSDIDYAFIASLIPDVMNALYNQQAFNSTGLEEIRDAFRIKQMQGKAWLMHKVSELVKDPNSKILVIGSWIGFTSHCLYKMGFTNITEVDPDSRLETLACWLNRFNKNFTHISDDVNNVDVGEFDVVINTSCEHIADNSWYSRLSKNSLVFLHSIDLPADDHCNLCQDLKEMTEKYSMNVVYSGTLNLQNYNRFMMIGHPR